MLVEKMHVMGLPNRETGLSMGRMRSVFLVLLDYDKYFCFQVHWKLARGSSHFCFIKMFRWFYSKPQANIIQGWGWGGWKMFQSLCLYSRRTWNPDASTQDVSSLPCLKSQSLAAADMYIVGVGSWLSHLCILRHFNHVQLFVTSG